MTRSPVRHSAKRYPARAELLSNEWKARLLLSAREAPEYFEHAESVVDGPHSSAIRMMLEDLGMSGVFCIQGVPIVSILSMETYDRNRVIDIHGALWNQGLASILLVICGDTARVFSLARVPLANLAEEFERRCLVETLKTVADVLALKNFLYSAESGRLWIEHANYFRPKERIDHVLLVNLIESHKALCKAHLSSDAAQALLIQTMFIAYLEDRGVINAEYFQTALKRNTETFISVLQTGDSSLLTRLFARLQEDFNGDLFVAPCSFEKNKIAPHLTSSHLHTLFLFRTGQEEMGTGQYRFWGYTFKFIPVELISAVYDRFLGEKEEERREQGAYYTPMFLADTVISHLWEKLANTTKQKGTFLDPACGSGMFLVRSFQRLCDYRRQVQTRPSQALRWDSLLSILSRLHGSDLNGSAVRVAVFSLYIALLEEVSPPDLRRLIKRGRILPPLWGKNLVCRDFFSRDSQTEKVDVVLGNPPWASRQGHESLSMAWCRNQQLPMPEGEDAWAFTWKAMQHLKPGGVLAFLLPAMSFLHNLAPNSCEARSLLISRSRVLRIINFSDLRFQLFDGAIRSTALLLCTDNTSPDLPYRFEYWTPRADVNLKIRRFITLTSADKKYLTSTSVKENTFEFKYQLWMRGPEAKLFKYLSKFSKLSATVRVFANARRDENGVQNDWLIGYGFQPARSGGPFSKSQFVGKLLYLPIEAFSPLALSLEGLTPWQSSKVFRRGFETAFHGPKILIPRGVGTAAGRLRAAYTEEHLTFRHIIQAISVPKGSEKDAKLLTAILNSRVAVWYAFHGTASFGSERPEVQQRDLLQLPFPKPSELPNERRARDAADALIKVIDNATRNTSAEFNLRHELNDEVFRRIDHLTYEYFCMSSDEILLIEDAVEHLIPAVQPSPGTIPKIWKSSNETERRKYADILLKSLREWFDDGTAIEARLEACNADLAVLRLTINSRNDEVSYKEEMNQEVGESLRRLSQHIHQPLPGNFQLLPDFRVYVGHQLYMIKPTQKRFWLRSSGLVDADSIALDLQEVKESGTRQSRSE